MFSAFFAFSPSVEAGGGPGFPTKGAQTLRIGSMSGCTDQVITTHASMQIHDCRLYDISCVFIRSVLCALYVSALP